MKRNNIIGFLRKVFIFSLLLLLCSMPVCVSANAPGPAARLVVAFSNLPEGAVYADILIKMDESDINYVAFEPNDYAPDVEAARELVEYCEDGYRSFTFHYRNANSNIALEHFYNEFYCVDFGDASDYNELHTQYEDLRKNYRDIKIVLLDQNFNILHVSKETSLPKERDLVVFDGLVYYDAANGSFRVPTRLNLFYIFLWLVVSVLVIGLSVGVEMLIAALLRMKGSKLRQILMVNLCTQLAMRVLYMLLPFAYLVETLILEILVYGTEFCIYKKRFADMSPARIAGYTIIANTVSLLLGVFLDYCIFL